MIFDFITAGIFDAATLFQWVVDNASYLLIFVLMTVESSFVPFPSEVVVPPAAYLACTKGDMNVFAVVLVATAGALCGALINYFLSLWIGRPLVYSFADSRLGHALLINREKVDKAEKYFDSHGAISTFLGRLIPAVRQLISIPAGLARMCSASSPLSEPESGTPCSPCSDGGLDAPCRLTSFSTKWRNTTTTSHGQALQSA